VTVGARVLGRRSVRRGVRAGLLAMALGLPGMAQGKRPPRRCTTAWEDVGPPPMGPAEGLDDPALDKPLDGELDPATQRRLQAALDTALDLTPFVGMQVAVGVPGAGRWTLARGLDRLDGRPVTLQDRFHVASAGKLLTATLVWQLVAAEAVALDAPISTWFPKAPNAEAATVAHLLSHRSGHGNFNANRRFQRSHDPIPTDDLLTRAFAETPLFCPNATAAYSNTGYLMLGEIVARSTGRPFAAVATERVLQPLGLTHSRVLPWDATDGPTVAGHRDGEAIGPQAWGRPHAAGPMVSTADELMGLLHGIISGRVLDEAQVDAMSRPMTPLAGMPGLHAGHGLMQLVPDGVPVVGHPGGITGFSAIVLVSPTHRAYVAVVANDEQTNVAAVAWTLLQAVRDAPTPTPHR